MKADYWHAKWSTNQIGFHLPQANPLLVRHFGKLELPKGARVFVPLCGKTRDIAWLLSQGCRVVGAELSRLAIDQLFAELDLAPKGTTVGPVEHLSASGLDIFVGDVFDLTPDALGKIDAVYDRAATIALPQETRSAYARHMINLSGRAPQLMVTMVYDQALMDGPPFSVDAAEVQRLYGSNYVISEITQQVIEGGFKGRIPAEEHVWLLTPDQG